MRGLRDLGFLALLPAFFAAACSDASTHPKPAANARIVVIPKGTTHVFWKAVEKGAREAGVERGLDVVWKGPLAENDRAQQIQLVQQFIAERPAGIALAPLDHAALVPAVRAARAAKIPIVIFDSALDGQAPDDFESFVATDNGAGGRLAGEELARLLGDTGEVVLLRYLVGSASTEEREAGFLAAVGKRASMKVLVDHRYAGATIGEAKTTALNLADALKQAKGVFASNEPATNGMLLALRQLGLAGKLEFVGFDASPPLVEALKAGEIDALVVQNPRKMGALAVATLADRLAGKIVPANVDTGAVLVTRENMHRPEVAALLE
ncbi:MAG: substrate-binding domain-containing protein [Planctomycetes bacterium]|nr:substrate-binding domain-containing protein [Planctomycetota bacterium]